MTDDTKKTMLTAVVGKVQKALGEAIAEKNQKTVENEILTASVEEEALQPYKSTSIIELGPHIFCFPARLILLDILLPAEC